MRVLSLTDISLFFFHQHLWIKGVQFQMTVDIKKNEVTIIRKAKNHLKNSRCFQFLQVISVLLKVCIILFCHPKKRKPVGEYLRSVFTLANIHNRLTSAEVSRIYQEQSKNLTNRSILKAREIRRINSSN